MSAGGAKRAESMARLLAAPLVFVYKRRPRDEVSEVLEMAGEVEGKDCVVVEDIISTGGTIVEVARALKRNGAGRVIIACSHAVLTPGAVERLREAPVDEVVVTNSVPLTPEAKKVQKIKVLSVAELLARGIRSIHEETSISELFI